MKTCPQCHVTKPFDKFYRRKGAKDGRAPWCADCSGASRREWYAIPENRARVKENARQYSIKNRPKEFARNLKRMYGLTVDDYHSLLLRHSFRCGICRVKFDKPKPLRPHVDHCHDTGKVRGLLCSNCNIAIGLLNDRVDVIQKAAEYVSSGGFLSDGLAPPRSACMPIDVQK